MTRTSAAFPRPEEAASDEHEGVSTTMDSEASSGEAQGFLSWRRENRAHGFTSDGTEKAR